MDQINEYIIPALLSITSITTVLSLITIVHVKNRVKTVEQQNTHLSNCLRQLQKDDDTELDAQVEGEQRSIDILTNSKKIIDIVLLVHNSIVQNNDFKAKFLDKMSDLETQQNELHNDTVASLSLQRSIVQSTHNVVEDTYEDVSRLHELLSETHHHKIVKKKVKKRHHRSDDSDEQLLMNV